MGINLQEYVNNGILGNVRTGKRDDKERPIKFSYFDVHTDKTTSELAVEIFNEVYNKPDKLKIRFVNQNPIEVFLERYEGRKRKCYGNNKCAKFLDDKGKIQDIKCDAVSCQYKKDKKCKFVAKLYFIIDKLEDEGIWCYPFGSENGIKKITRRIARANRKGEDLTSNWYELFLEEEDAPTVGKNYIPDIRKLEAINKENKPEEKPKEINNKKGNEGSKTNKTNPNYLMIKGFRISMFENKKVTKIIFVNVDSKEEELILLPEANQEILDMKPGSIIIPSSISRRDNVGILNGYQIIKRISDEIKEAV